MALKPTLSFDDISGVIGKDVKEFCDVNFIKVRSNTLITKSYIYNIEVEEIKS